jgi:hypothetical protein
MHGGQEPPATERGELIDQLAKLLGKYAEDTGTTYNLNTATLPLPEQLADFILENFKPKQPPAIPAAFDIVEGFVNAYDKAKNRWQPTPPLNTEELPPIKLPVEYDGHGTYIFDAAGLMIADVRGWGWIQKLADPEQKQDALGQFIAEAINEKFARPSSLPPKELEKEIDIILTRLLWGGGTKFKPKARQQLLALYPAGQRLDHEQLEKQILGLCEAVWRLGRGTALDLPLDPELLPEDATKKIIALFNQYALAHHQVDVEEAAAYPWEKIAKHAVYSVPIVDLDTDPTGSTTIYQDCYMLPKKWVDEQLEQRKNIKEEM